MESNRDYRKNPQDYLNKALYYYYHQNPNYRPDYKLCAYPINQPNIRDKSYYDECPDNYYRVCEKYKSLWF